MSHWYDSEGEPCHTSIGAKGKEVKTTLTQARKRMLYPSVTTVLDILAKPALDKWKARQITDACFNEPLGNAQRTADEFNKDMVEKAFTQVDDAADLGTEIHAAIESYFTNTHYDFSKKLNFPGGEEVEAVDICRDVGKWIVDHNVTIQDCELRLVNKELGYAGLTDATITQDGKQGIMDFKTRKTKEFNKVSAYDNEPTQIAAYHMAKYGKIDKDSIGCNLYISTTEIGRIEVVWYDADELAHHWEKFQLCLGLWQNMKRYYPQKANK